MKDRRTPQTSQPSALDRNQLQQVRENFLALNAYRLNFARGIFSENQRLYLDLLPALLHFNHPMLPGYCDRKTPAGVYQYQVSEQTSKRLRRLAKSFHPNRSKNQRPDICALFTMGSLGSLAQNAQSDIDIWLCYRPDLPATGVQLLTEKAEKISAWATSFGIDTTLFLMNPLDFYQGKNQQLDKESSGNTQHLLLLDEFYRTAILIAGQLPIWLFTLRNKVEHYAHDTQALFEDKRLPDKQLIDFGTLESIPYGEFVSAAIWQLYKAIESPYKSIIKLLLIEIYASNNQAPTFLANQFKNWLQRAQLNDVLSLDDYDPYYKTYEFIESYLIDSQQKDRLDLLRRCFYFKVAHPLTQSNNENSKEKNLFIEKIINQWGWDKAFVSRLDQRKNWKTNTVNRERSIIIKALNDSYRFIIDFLKKENAAVHASNKELNILGRKLHAAFAKKVGKVDWINPGISSDIFEPSILVKKENSIWQACTPNNELLLEKKTLLSLLVNLYCNQIISKQSKIITDRLIDTPIDKAVEKIRASIPALLAPAEHHQFEQQCYTRKVVLFIHSFEKPDYFLIPDQPEQQIYYLQQTCKIDVVMINNWNEITCDQKSGEADRIIPEIFSACLNSTNALPAVESHFFDDNIAQALQPYIKQLQQNLNTFCRANIQGQYILKNSSGYAVLPIANTTEFSQYGSLADLHQALTTTHNQFSGLAIDPTLTGSQLAAFARHNRKDCIQIFFEVRDKKADVTIIDEQGSFYFSSIRYKNPQQSLLPIYAYCRAVNERRLSASTAELSPLDILPISTYELQLRNKQWRAEQIYLNNQAAIDHEFALQGFAEYKNHEFVFTLYCDEQRFSEEDEKSAAYQKMFNWMRTRAKNSQHPFDYTITDLDISHCQAAFAPEQTLQTAHYLQVKTALETKIQQALSSQR